MKNFAVFILLVSLSLTAFAQKKRRPVRPANTPVVAVDPANEKADFDKAKAVTDATTRIAALQKFIADYPKSTEKTRALELITSARAAVADDKFRAGDTQAAAEIFRLAVSETPKPISDTLFTNVILQIPNSLFFRGAGAAAIEIAKIIEEKTADNAAQTLALATFYLATENAPAAKRLANRAAALEPNLAAAYRTLGMANRLDFQFEESAAAYQKALELDAESATSKRSLAEMKRAAGKSAEAVSLYREILAKDATDAAAQTGLILALFESENKAEAETEMQKSLEANPNNLFLLSGAAYWYAAHNDGAKAVELAEKAVAVEPRYTWARIALARGLMLQKRPLEAEKTLLGARQYGDFPTLDYELAAARLQAGFYREAAEILQRKFVVKDNSVETNLGGRIPTKAKNFVELLAAERRASIFQTLAADNTETADRLKSLLDFSEKIDTATDEEIAAATDEFVKGEDKMKLHRRLYAANQLVQKRKALPKAVELTKSIIGVVDSGLDITDAAAAVLADEMYQSRQLALSRNEVVLVPDLPRQTLSNIVRGRIEDVAGTALLQDNKPAEAVTRLKRAVSILPEKSSFWRNSLWRLGTAQEASGNFKDALDSYVKSYTEGGADIIKYGVIESVYQKVNGGTDGLEAKIGVKPASLTADSSTLNKSSEKSEFRKSLTLETKTETPTAPSPTPTETSNQTAPPVVEPSPEVTASPTPVKVEPTPEIKPETEVVKPKVEETPVPIETPKIEPTPTETPKVEPTPEIVKPEPTTEKTLEETKPVNVETPKVEPTPPIENSVAENKSKSLFEPIVINVPKVETSKKTTENVAPKTEIKPDETKTETRAETKADETKAEDINARPRVVVTDNLTENVAAPTTLPQCRIVSGQETVSLKNNGGNLSVLLRLEGETNRKAITAASSSPNDIEVIYEPEFGVEQSNRSYFGIKSISTKTGLFTVTFDSACGKKEIAVNVR